MGKSIPPSEGSAGLRQKAEEIFSEKGGRFPEDTMTLSPEETRQIVHELRVHQIELEMQNDELHRAQDELDASRAHYSDFYDLAPVGYFTLSEQGLILEVNLFAATLLGMPRSELFKQPISRFIFRDDQDIYYLHRKRLFESGEPREYELRMVNTDGVPFWACLIATISQGDGDSVCRVIMSNITDRKQAEAEKEKLQDRLNQAQKMESIGRLAGGVAHDFNNMLGVILGHAELALAEMDPALPLYADLEEIRKAAQRSADLTRQLLAFARKQTVAPRILDLNDTLMGMRKMLHRLIGENIDLAFIPGENLWPVKMDPGQIDQILTNLCLNARDAIAGMGKITIQTKNQILDEVWCSHHTGSMPGQYVLLTVTDTGCGMDREMLDHLFEPFFTTKDVGKGTGLGLSMVYGAVRQNNGFITVHSEPGSGTSFRIYLQRHLEKTDPLPAKGPVPSAARGSETILVVEDEPAIMTLTTAVLQRLGYAVVAAGSPGEAIRLAEIHPSHIHLLITDVVMPGMNGHELAKTLLPIYPHLKCLFMSGYTSDIIAHQGILDKGVHFIQKPFSMTELGARVRAVLDEIDEIR